MSLLISLFGGMLLTAALYGAARYVRLSNFWAAVLAAGLPGMAYLVWAVARWPGLDVVTLHVVAYPTVAVMLNQLYGSKADHARTLHWAPKLMIVFFLGITVVFGAFVYVASNGLPPALARIFLPDSGGRPVYTGFAGVVEHKTDAAKGIGHHLKNEHKLAQLGWRMEVTGLGNMKAGIQNPVSVRLTNLAGQVVSDVAVSIGLARPGMKHQSASTLPLGAEGIYQGYLGVETPGTWVAYITLMGHGETVRLEHTLEAR